MQLSTLPQSGCFNTQPRGGGCVLQYIGEDLWIKFQHTAARRRLQKILSLIYSILMFQHTAARRRLQADKVEIDISHEFQHTAARRRLPFSILICLLSIIVSTHSRAEAAATMRQPGRLCLRVSTHSRAEAAALCFPKNALYVLFQHTAARRRLLSY